MSGTPFLFPQSGLCESTFLPGPFKLHIQLTSTTQARKVRVSSCLRLLYVPGYYESGSEGTMLFIIKPRIALV